MAPQVQVKVTDYQCPECKDRGIVYITRRKHKRDDGQTKTMGKYPCLSCEAGKKYLHEGPQVFRFNTAPAVNYPLVERPQTRGDCLPGGCNAARPCPFVSCAHHLYLDFIPPKAGDGSPALRLSFPQREVWELPETCALDVADRGGVTLEEVGDLNNVTRERVRQLETALLVKCKAAAADFDSDVPLVPTRIRVYKAGR